MAGSEQEGVDGASADLFEGAVWVLTPTPTTSDAAYADVAAVVRSFGAEVVALPPERHDALVAVVSHVPHLTAATLMRLADDRRRGAPRAAAARRRRLPRHDPDRGRPSRASGPTSAARTATRSSRASTASSTRCRRCARVVAADDRDRLLEVLDTARAGSREPARRVRRPEELCEVRVPVPDRPGVLAEVTTLASELDVNIADLEIAHSSEGEQGVLILLVETRQSDVLRDGLVARGYRPA